MMCTYVFANLGLKNHVENNYSKCLETSTRLKVVALKVSYFRKQIFLFSFEPKTEQNCSLISALASERSSNQKTLLHNHVI